jgi:hypothetical protein
MLHVEMCREALARPSTSSGSCESIGARRLDRLEEVCAAIWGLERLRRFEDNVPPGLDIAAIYCKMAEFE